MFFLGDGIVPAGMKGITAQNSPERKKKALYRPEPLDCLSAYCEQVG
jgi:hypothetical protein